MSEHPDGFAPPPFKPDEAVVQLKRSLRDLELAERMNGSVSGFELNGKRVLELQADATSITARMARKPALTPEWDRQLIRSAADQRRLVDELKRRLARWDHDE